MTIDTYLLDTYVQAVMTEDSGLPTADRIDSAVAAIGVHVLTNAGLPMNTPLLADPDDVSYLEAHLQDAYADAVDNLDEKIDEAYDALGIERVYEYEDPGSTFIEPSKVRLTQSDLDAAAAINMNEVAGYPYLDLSNITMPEVAPGGEPKFFDRVPDELEIRVKGYFDSASQHQKGSRNR